MDNGVLEVTMDAIEIRRGYEAMARGDGTVLAAMLSPDATWHIPGRSPLAGSHRGLGAIFAFWKKVAVLADGGMKLEVLDVLANQERAAVFVVGRSHRKGLTLEERGVHIYRFQAGKVIEGRFYYEDQDAYDEFWSA